MTMRPFLIRFSLACGVLALFAAVAIPQTSDDNDPILKAMHDELDRSRQLRIVGGGDDAPYFFSYELSDADSLHINASMGAVISSNHSHLRSPFVEVRVGSYDFDNTGHIYSGIYTGSRMDGSWPLDDNYTVLREALWLSTDRVYKTALESMSRKRAALNNANAPTEKIPDYSKADPIKNLQKITHKKIDEAGWTAKMVKLSALFKTYPEVMASDVEFEEIDGGTYLMNSEGTALRYMDNVAYINAKAEGQAPDGMLVRDAAVFDALDAEKLPGEAEVRAKLT